MTLKDFFERYGSTMAVVAVAALVLVILPGNNNRATDVTAGATGTGEGIGGFDDPTAAGQEGATGGGDAATAGGATGGAGGGQAAAGPAGRIATGGGQAKVAVGQGPHCRPDGRQKGVAKYMPPCVDFSGDNGGATGMGVTKDQVKIVRFISQTDDATAAILKANKLYDDPPIVQRVYEALFKYGNQHYQTYGREVVFENYNASGPDDSDEAMKADAIKIATEKKPLAVWGGPKVFGQEIARRGVICICTVSLTSQFYQENPPYIFGSLPTLTEYAIHLSEFIGKRLANKPAKWAGDELNPTQGYRTKNRVFGLIYINGNKGRVDPEGKRARDTIVSELAKYGVQIAAEYAYLYDPGRNQQDVTNMISRMKSAGVTTVIPIVDPLYPILITREATQQQYFPEWFVTGTGLSDTSAAGRLYESTQWRHAFGISPLWVTWKDVRQSEGYREFHHGMPGRNPGDEGILINIYRAPVQQLFTGIQMAGPKLNADTFSKGTFSYPKTGGTPGLPLVYLTRQFPTQIKDFVEVWYSYEESGKDERGEQGNGMMMKVDQGKRYTAGQWPATEPKAFIRENAIAVSDNPPGGGHPPHEQDGHRHAERCLSCK